MENILDTIFDIPAAKDAPAIRVDSGDAGDAIISQDSGEYIAEIFVEPAQLPALISALQAALPDSTPPTVSKGDGA